MEKIGKLEGKNVDILTILLVKKTSSLVFVSFSIVHVDRVESDLLVVLLQSSEVLPGLGELSLLHSLSDVPVDECTFSVHEVKLVVEPGPGLSNGGGVGEHADTPRYLGQISTRDNGWWLVVDSDLEAGGTPVNKLDG